MTTVRSSNIASVGYDPLTCTLVIAFHSGGVYAYFGVPWSVYRGLMQAESHGRYFHARIKDCYDYQRAG